MSAGPFDNPYHSSSDKFSNATTTQPRGDINSSCKSIALWQSFFSILLAVGTVIMFGVLAVQMIFTVGADNPGGAIGSVVGLGVLTGFLILFYVIPSILLWKASAAARAVAQGQTSSLDEMLSRQKSFWRYAGIATIVIIGFYVLIMLLALVIGIGAASIR